MTTRGHLWISPGAAIGGVLILCVLALIIVFGVVPAQSADKARQADEKQRAAQRIAGQRLLHNFDCTYGKAIHLTLDEAHRSQTVSAHIALQARHAALQRRDVKAAHRALVSYRNATAAAQEYARVSASLRPFLPQLPCS